MGGAVGDAFGAFTECVPMEDNMRLYGDVRRFEDIEEAMAEELNAIRGFSVDPKDVGVVTDDTYLSDLLLECILGCGGDLDAHVFASYWPRLDRLIENGARGPFRRIDRLHHIERIPYYRNMFREIPKRELGHGEANATNAVMYILPVGLLCAGDPLKAAIMAADVSSVNQHGRPRDAAAGYAAAVAACLIPGIGHGEVVEAAIRYTRDERSVRELRAIVGLAEGCADCGEIVSRYWSEILGGIIPMQDEQHYGTKALVTWNSSEVLGVALGTFLITRGGGGGEAVRHCALNGRDADTSARLAGGLAGAFGGVGSLPADWVRYVAEANPWMGLEAKAERLTAIIKADRSRLAEAWRD